MSSFFGGFFDEARPESQGLTPEEMAKAEENEEEWDDRIGFHPQSQKPVDAYDSQEDQEDKEKIEESKKWSMGHLKYFPKKHGVN